jgi:hypothetical protein
MKRHVVYQSLYKVPSTALANLAQTKAFAAVKKPRPASKNPEWHFSSGRASRRVHHEARRDQAPRGLR